MHVLLGSDTLVRVEDLNKLLDGAVNQVSPFAFSLRGLGFRVYALAQRVARDALHPDRNILSDACPVSGRAVLLSTGQSGVQHLLGLIRGVRRKYLERY